MAGSLDLGSLILRVTCNTSDAVEGLNEVADKATSATSNIQKLDQAGSSLTSLGKTISASVTVPLVALGTAAVNTGMDFEQAMAQVQATAGIASKTSDDFKALEAAARDVGRATQLSSTDAANALYYMALAGWDTKEMLAGITPVANLSIATMTDLATTSDIVTDAFTAFGYETDQLIEGIPAVDHFVDVLAQTVRNTNTDVIQLGEAFRYVAPLCGALGFSVEDAAIALGLMANSGVKASTAGTSLRSALTNLARPTDRMKASMDELGISLSKNGETTISLKELMDQMREAFKDLNVSCVDSSGNLLEYDSLLQAVAENGDNAVDSITGLTQVQKIEAAANIFGKQAMSGMLAIVTSTDEAYQSLTESIYNSNGAAQQMVDIMMDTGKGSLEQISSAIEDIGISLYKNVEVALKGVLKKVEEFSNALANLMVESPEFTQKFIQVGASIAAIGPALIIAGTAMKALADMTRVTNTVLKTLGITASVSVSGFVALAAAIVAFGVGIKNNVGGILDNIKTSLAVVESSLYRNKNTWDTVLSIISSMCHSFYNSVIVPVFSGIGEILLFAGEIFNSFYNAVSDAMLPVMYLIQKFYFDIVEPVFSGMVERVREVVQVVRNNFPLIESTIGNVVSTVGEFLYNVLGTALTETIGLFKAVQPTAEVVWNAVLVIVSASIQGICDFINNLLLPMFRSFTRFLEVYLLPIVTNIWEGISTVIQGRGGEASQFIHETLLPAIQKFSDFMNFTVYPAVKEVWDGILDTIGSATIAITIWVQDKLIPAIQNFATYVVEELWPKVQEVWNNIKECIGIAVDTISTFIKDTLIPTFKDMVAFVTETLWPAIQNVWSLISGFVVEHVGKMVEQVKSFLIPAFQGIADVFNDHVVPLFQTAWESLKETVQIAIDVITPFIRDFLIPVFKTISDILVDYVWPMFKEAWNIMLDVVSVVIDAIRIAIETVLMPVIRALGDFCIKFLWPAFNETWTFISNVVKLVIGTLVDLWFDSLKPCYEAMKEYLQVYLLPVFKVVWEGIKLAVKAACAVISPIVEGVRKLLSFLGLDATTTGTAFDAAFAVIKVVVNVTAGVIKAAVGVITSSLKTVSTTVNWLKKTITPVLEGIGSLFKRIFGGASKDVDKASGKMKDMPKSSKKAKDGVKELDKGVKDLSRTISENTEVVGGMEESYSEFYDDLSPKFQKAVQNMSVDFHDFSMEVGNFNLDGVITQEEADSVSTRVANLVDGCQSALGGKAEEIQNTLKDLLASDGTWSAIDQATYDYWQQYYQTNSAEVVRIQQEINDIMNQAAAEGRNLTPEEEQAIRDKYARIQQIELECSANNSQELLYARKEFQNRLNLLDAEGAAELWQQRQKQFAEQQLEVATKYDTLIEMEKEHQVGMTDEEKLASEERIQNLELAKQQQLQKNKDYYEDDWEYLQEHCANLGETIDKYNGDIMDKTDKTCNANFERMKSHYSGLEGITESGMYSLYNKTSKTYEDIIVNVDEATGEIIGLTRTWTDEYGTHTGEVTGYNKDIKKSTDEMQAKLVKDINAVTKGLQDGSLSYDSSTGKIVDSNGKVVGSMEKLTDGNGKVTDSITKINGKPVKVNGNWLEATRNANNVKRAIDDIPKRKDITITTHQIEKRSVQQGKAMPGFAEGTMNAPRGVAMVAEEGPELIKDNKGNTRLASVPMIYDFKGGERVFTASQTANMLANMAKTKQLMQENLTLPRIALAGPRMGSNDFSSINALLLDMIGAMKGVEVNNNLIVDHRALAKVMVKPFEQEINKVQRNRNFVKGGNLIG